MDRRRLLISIKGDKFNPEDAIFSGTCVAKTVNIYCSGASGTDKIHYVDNKDGTYNWYFILPDKGMYWTDRFVWYKSEDIKSLKLSSKLSSASTRNNRFNSTSVESYDFGTAKIATNSLRESFYNCKKLKSLDISNWDLSDCSNLYAFSANNDSIEVVALPDTITPTGLTQVDKMFGWNWKLHTITGMKTVDFSKVAYFSEMFCECRELSNIEFNINNWVTSSATDIHSMFLQCFKLDLAALGDFSTWDVSNVTDFSYCVARTKTTRLSLSGWDMRSAVNIKGMFQQNVGADANNSLNTLNLSGVKLDPSKITSHAYVFAYCNHLQQISLTDCDNSTGMIEFIEDQLLTDIPGEVKAENVHLLLDDGANTYDEAHNQGWVPVNRLIGVVVPAAADVPEGYNSRMSNEGVYLASKIGEDYNITAEDVASIKTAEPATSVTFDARCIFPDEAQTAANTFFNKCFDGMLSLSDVYMLGVDDAVVLAAKTSNFGGTDTSILGNIKVHTDKGVFVFKNNLWVLYDDGDVPIIFADDETKRICVENWGSDGEITKNQAKAVTTLGTVFKDNTKITSFNELKYFTGVKSLSAECFNNCTSLSKLNLDNITDTIGDKALRCTRLTGELTIKANRIGGVFVSRVPDITRVNLPNVSIIADTSKTEGFNFNYCDSLTTIDFGENLKVLYDGNFGVSSPLLKTIIFRGNVPSNINFRPNSGSATATYYVPDKYFSNWQTKFTSLTFKPFSEAPEGLL